MSNREIKFRAYNKASGRMFFPCNSRYDISIVFNEWGWEVYDHFSGKPVTLVQSWTDMRTVNPDAILMCYTGLKDKNGIEICEGDIVKTGYRSNNGDFTYLAKVVWIEKDSCYGLQNSVDIKENSYRRLTIKTISKHKDKDLITVVGNIYQNPELLTIQ